MALMIAIRNMHIEAVTLRYRVTSQNETRRAPAAIFISHKNCKMRLEALNETITLPKESIQ